MSTCTIPTVKLLGRMDRPTREGCWTWKGAHTQAGYASVRTGQRTDYVHRIMYEKFTGPIPEGHQIDHLCRNRGCVNPLHLEAVTPRENILRGEGPTAINARKTHCLRGHALEGDNLYVPADGFRRCRACKGQKAAA